MCADLFGPRSFRCSDLELLRESDLNTKLAVLQQGHPMQYKSYGDGIFPISSHTIGKHVGDTTVDERYENRMMSKIRISNEWNYGVTANLFPFVKWKAGQKLRSHQLTARYYIVATLLRNAHICLYEGITNEYFNCPSPSLYEYFKV